MSSSEIVTVPQSGVEKRIRVRFPEHRRGRTLNQPPLKNCVSIGAAIQLMYLIQSDSRILRLLVISVCENRCSVKPKYKVAKSEYRDTRSHSITGDKSETPTKRMRNQLGYQISPQRFGPPDAKSGQPTCVNASEQGTQENIRDESYLPERLAVP
ncbi:hypothetical protein T03_1095 [Trichinella britovi]|uniref:Uncharacterized protein n=1 Tax=Trichinella britovi TaxID=45882 RepID=A0A0V1D295_TRIBR|nr:hypothetical protein T03_1095 [Trichinella britovi]